ncbi:putative two-component response regulator [Gordonia effusa NBRC 100432]|uniref:Putative two-component response regulator n=1 Tax=Gordonia effusa NBRC 100432 TaxID=1077974 RepID=H0R5U5_9ACTN|nr:response regulator transcription factor [Gordonia effusa]GAB20446.1 putative two-component response regulator [Gordonia effusa NBRC 100432]
MCAASEPKVLVVDDDPTILVALMRGLSISGFRVDTAKSGTAALDLARSIEFDGVVLDLNMPGTGGISVISSLRASGSTVPICVLSARMAVDDRIQCLEKGADDYLVKPFDLGELVARLHALIRRSQQTNRTVRSRLECGPLVVDVAGRQVHVSDRLVELTRREYELLQTLVERQGEVVSRADLLRFVWGYDFPTDTNVVDVFVGYLRRKLAQSGAKPPIIHTVRGVGFVIRPQ